MQASGFIVEYLTGEFFNKRGIWVAFGCQLGAELSSKKDNQRNIPRRENISEISGADCGRFEAGRNCQKHQRKERRICFSGKP